VKSAKFDLAESTFGEIQDGEQRPNLTQLSHNSSAADCSISPKFVVWVNYGSPEVAELLSLYCMYVAALWIS